MNFSKDRLKIKPLRGMDNDNWTIIQPLLRCESCLKARKFWPNKRTEEFGTFNKDCWGAAPVREWRKQRCSRNAGQITLRIEGETVIEGDGGGKWSRAEVILLVIDSVQFFQQPRNFARNGKCGTNNLSIIQHACAIYLDFLHLRSAKRIKTPAILIKLFYP